MSESTEKAVEFWSAPEGERSWNTVGQVPSKKQSLEDLSLFTKRLEVIRHESD